jgi:hypothetical protein
VSLQVRQEVLNQGINGVNKVMERWEQRFTLADPDFAKRFRSGKQTFVLHLRSSIDSAELRAAEFVHEHRADAHFSDPIGMAHDHLPHGKKQAVFAGIVKLVKQPQRMISALVRL